MRKVFSKDRFIVLWIAVAVLMAFTQTAQAGEGLTKIAENVYSYVDVKDASPQKSFGANAGIIIGSDGIVVIDTLTSSKEAKRFIKDIKAVSDKPVKYVINTHSHLDHTFGNSEFEKLGAVIISHKNCREAMINSGEAALVYAKDFGLTDEDLEGTGIAYPVFTFQDSMGIDGDAGKIELIFAGPSHTAGSIIVYLPDSGILFTGDILFTDFHPFMANGDIESWTKVLDYITALNVDTIIPGHGPVSSKKDVANMKEYLITFDKKAKELAASSDDVEYITSELMKILPARTRLASLVGANVQMKYLKQNLKQK